MDLSRYLVPLMAAITLFVPGLLLLLALGVRARVHLAGLSAPVTVGFALLVASVLGLVGLPFGAVSMWVATLVVGAATFALRRWAIRPGPVREDIDGPKPTVLPALPVTVDKIAQIFGGVLVLGAFALGMATWMEGIGAWSTYNQDHDTIQHYLLTSYIQRTGDAAPWLQTPSDLLTGSNPTFYPDGLHMIAAIAGAPFGSAVVGMNAVVAVWFGIAWALSAAALTAVAARQFAVQRGWTFFAAGVAAIVAVGIYRPAFNLVRDNGLFPNAATLVLVPGVAAAILALRRREWSAVIAVGLAVCGLLITHPSSAASLGVTLGVLLVAGALTTGGWKWIRARWSTWAVALGAAVLASLPLLIQLLKIAGGGGSTGFPPVTEGTPVLQSAAKVIPLVYSGFVDPRPLMTQSWATVLLLAGVVTVLVLRRGMNVLLVWATWVLITIGAMWDITVFPLNVVGAFFYNSAGRIWGNVPLFAPTLAALGVVGLGALASLALRRGRIRSNVAATLAIVLAGLLIVVYTAFPARAYHSTNAQALADRWSEPQFHRVNEYDRAAARWLSRHVGPGERVMNAANDGSTFAYVRYGVPLVNVYTLGVASVPYTWGLLTRFNQAASDPQVCQWIKELNITYVYDGNQAPLIGSAGAPNDWANGQAVSTSPGLDQLAEKPWLQKRFERGTVTVYEVEQSKLPCFSGTGN